MHNSNQSDAAVKGVVEFAREVRLHMRDSTVIFGTVVSSPPSRDALAFMIRPWGLRTTMTVDFQTVSRAVAVKVMLWKQQKSISAAQLAGDFSGPTLHHPPVRRATIPGPQLSAANDNHLPAAEPIPVS